MAKNSINYEDIPSGYYDVAVNEGNFVQQYWHREKFNVVLQRIGCLKGRTLLDIGCGPGTFLSLLPLEYEEATGVDISKTQIGFAVKKNSLNKKIKWVVGDPLTLKLGSYDVITSIELIEHLEEDVVGQLFDCVGKNLKSGGRFIVTTPNYKSLWPFIEWVWSRIGFINYSEQHVTHFTEKKLCALLELYKFKVVHSSTFFVVSPFLAPVSYRLAKFVQRFEQRFLRGFGSIIVCEAFCRQKV
ncbi:class I SAM-dependent methyltransferase [Candidatus Woesearchaeota archaeon]|nr:class I SAM-dependent methyltransferase [Candidatus Woesearchaeota archaeon]